MAMPGEHGSPFPTAYLTKVPHRVQRREDRLAGAAGSGGSTLLDLPAQLRLHEDERLYFDYGAVRLGRKTDLEYPTAPKPVCVGFGWLPGWAFTMSERGVPDIVPAPLSPPTSPQAPVHGHETARRETPPGVLGLVYQLQREGQPPTSRSLFRKKAAVRVEDLVYATAKDWDTTIDFHGQHKALKQTDVYLHLFDGALGHKFQKDGAVVPFRTPRWPVAAVVHVDPPSRGPLIRTKKTTVPERRLQGDWVARDLEKWVKEAGLPPAYVEEVLQEWILADPGIERKAPPGGGLKGFLGFG